MALFDGNDVLRSLLGTPEGYATPGQVQFARELAKSTLTANQPEHKHWLSAAGQLMKNLAAYNMINRANRGEMGGMRQAQEGEVGLGKKLLGISDVPSGVASGVRKAAEVESIDGTGGGSAKVAADDETPPLTDVSQLPSRTSPGAANFANSKNFGQPGSIPLSSVGVEDNKFSVHTKVADNYQGFLDEMKRLGYSPISSGGYANRTKRTVGGTPFGGYSQHAYGNAIDIENWVDADGNKVPASKMPKWVGDLAATHGLTWGGDWTKNNDPMHFEYHGAHGVDQRPYGYIASQNKGKNEHKVASADPTFVPSDVSMKPQGPAFPKDATQEGPAQPSGVPGIQVAQNAPQGLQGPGNVPVPIPDRASTIDEKTLRQLTGPWADPKVKERLFNSIEQSSSPGKIETAGGTIMYDRHNPQNRIFLPGKPVTSKMKIGDVEHEISITYDAHGNPKAQLAIPGEGSGGISQSGGDIKTPLDNPYIKKSIEQNRQQKLQTEAATELQKGSLKEINETRDRGDRARNAMSLLDIMDEINAHEAAGKNVGPTAERIDFWKKRANNLLPATFQFDEKPIAANELINKISTHLAAEGAHSLTNRPTQFDFQKFMQANGDLTTSIPGRKALSNIMRQVMQREVELSREASRVKDPSKWEDIKDSVFDKHKITLNGTVLGSGSKIDPKTGEIKKPIGTHFSREKGLYTPDSK
jgi:hypothetical protein